MSESPANLLQSLSALVKRHPRLAIMAFGAATAFGYPPYGLWPISLAALAARGDGRAVLPTFVGRLTPGLIQIGSSRSVPSVPVWVACHRDLAKSGRLTRARRFLVDRLSEERLS